MLDRCPDVLRADMQRFYGLDIDRIGRGVRVRRAADLAANLPEEARVWGRMDARAAWDTRTQLLAQATDAVDWLAWSQTRDAQRRGARWKGRIPRPWETENARRRRDPEAQAMSVERLQTLLNKPRQ